MLPGRTCDCCVRYYNRLRDEGWTEEEVQDRIEKFSHHQSKHQAPPTPPGFWNPVFTDEEDSPKKNYNTTPPGLVRWSTNKYGSWSPIRRRLLHLLRRRLLKSNYSLHNLLDKLL
jgi:hypothetical protein